jgi:hypothetical protein
MFDQRQAAYGPLLLACDPMALDNFATGRRAPKWHGCGGPPPHAFRGDADPQLMALARNECIRANPARSRLAARPVALIGLLNCFESLGFEVLGFLVGLEGLRHPFH